MCAGNGRDRVRKQRRRRRHRRGNMAREKAGGWVVATLSTRTAASWSRAFASSPQPPLTSQLCTAMKLRGCDVGGGGGRSLEGHHTADQKLGLSTSRHMSGAWRASTTRGKPGWHPPTIPRVSASRHMASAALSWAVRGTWQPRSGELGIGRTEMLTRLSWTPPAGVLCFLREPISS